MRSKYLEYDLRDNVLCSCQVELEHDTCISCSFKILWGGKAAYQAFTIFVFFFEVNGSEVFLFEEEYGADSNRGGSSSSSPT